MPNRVIRDWTDSERMDGISFQAEVLFVRLMMKADDYGSFHANPKLINSFCFPLKNLRETDISRWLHELVTAGLIALYDAGGKQYLNILNFGQRLRSMKKAFPQFDSNSPQLAATRAPETEEETEVETEEEGNRGKPPPTQKKFLKPTIEELVDYFSTKNFEKKLNWPAQKILSTAEKFFNFYESKGWMIGKNKMKDWRAAVSGQWLTEKNWNNGTNRQSDGTPTSGNRKSTGAQQLLSSLKADLGIS